MTLRGGAEGESGACRPGIPPICPGVVLRLSAGGENIPSGNGSEGWLDRKRAATVSRGWGKGIKDQEINASISSNTAGHSSALWRRVCAPFFLLFEKLLCAEPPSS